MGGGIGGAGEEHRELAARELGAHIGGVACLLEQVGVGVEGHARAGVAEDPTHLNNIQPDVDDQVAGEGVAQIVEAHPSTFDIDACFDGRPT